MKLFAISFLIIIGLFACSPPAYTQDNKTLDYPSLYLAQWVYNCSQALYPMFFNQGTPRPFAMQLAAESCACVVDNFRKNFSWLEVQTMLREDRALFSETYAHKCKPYGINL
jgi:hypothetical protein